ncbi:MAG: HD domain-containing protein [Chloroflexi bacterium CFX2]|nr:HD domain-containing protein [Chloroflexi bacterium CFX2]
MLSSDRMKQRLEKNFSLLVSLLLEGVGAGLVLIPDHFGIGSDLYFTGLPAVLGLACFVLALSLQLSCVWRFPKKREIVVQTLTLPFLLFSSVLLMKSGQVIGGVAMLIGGIMQAVVAVSKWVGRLRRVDFSRLMIGLTTFAAGMVLAFSGFDSHPRGSPVFMPYLAAAFLISAFASGVTVIFPSFHFDAVLNYLQIIPWVVLSFLFIQTPGSKNLVVPAAIIFVTVFGKLIPWERIIIPDGDILSRRVVMIAFFSEVAHLIFMGALLFTIDPGLDGAKKFILSAREATLGFFVLFSAMIYYVATTVVMTTSGLIKELNRGDEDHGTELGLPQTRAGVWSGRLDRYIRPFIMTSEGIRGRIQADQIQTLARQAATEKKRNAQLTLLLELSQQLENQLDQPVSAQLVVNTLERALNCNLVMIFLHEYEKKEFMLIASAGRGANIVPTGYRQNAAQGVLGRALRQRKTQVVDDILSEKDYIPFVGETNLSGVAVPLIMNGHVTGMITLNSEKPSDFGSVEIGMAEMAAAELIRAWERSGHHQRLMELVQTGSQLASALDPEKTAQEVAWRSREILQAKFTFIYIQLGQEQNFIQQACSGSAPLLYGAVTSAFASGELNDLALRASQPFRIRDVRRYPRTANLRLDNPALRSLLVIPIRWHQVNIGGIFAFGKKNETFFTENDEALAELISIQASGAFESAWLQQELRASLRITSLLYRLSNKIILSENIEDAASDIAQTAHKLARSITTGIVLLNPDQSILAEVRVDEEGSRIDSDHPMSLVHDAIKSNQMIYISQGKSILRTCLPIQTPVRSYGAIWMDTHDDPLKKTAANPNDLQALVHQAAVALERSLLLVESRRQAKEIKEAYDKLEATYDQTLASLTSALDARDRETEGHSSRVTQLAVKLGRSLGYSQDQLKILERGALLHDIGKIGISDTILHKPGELSAEEWTIMKFHPDIGAKIVSGIPFLQETIPVIRSHQERWDGSGYPDGLKGTNIPELARLFAVVDAFDALTSDRPYRKKISNDEALGYLREQSGILFDPDMVTSFENLLLQDSGVIDI